MKKIILTGIALIMLFSVVSAAQTKSTDIDLEKELQQAFDSNGKLTEKYQTDVNIINSWTKDFPSAITSVFGNERMNVYLNMIEGKKHTIGVITENAKITEVKYGGIAEPTMNVHLNENTAKKIYKSENKINALQQSLLNNEITYDAVSIPAIAKKTIIDAVINIFRFFNLFTAWTVMFPANG